METFSTAFFEAFGKSEPSERQKIPGSTKVRAVQTCLRQRRECCVLPPCREGVGGRIAGQTSLAKHRRRRESQN
ncbi:hypothetical protein E2C01_049639 [Portunus trituberculatus]|uniref:Uncharacterized protein n=1 Tax=Portunus trituberculatus TaxID=210409 RepID=A0A5B7GE79_PORTR|nr:hypothetical protein [Portunus trituberculatus]